MDDQMVLADVFGELGCQDRVIFFGDGQRAMEYLYGTDDKPFLILSDINLPGAWRPRDELHNKGDRHLKCIPFLFFTTAVPPNAVMDACSRSVQGFFIKPDNYGKLRQTIKK